MRPANPFLMTGYLAPEFFCDRKTETEILHNSMNNGRNVTLISIRQMGKSALLNHLFHTIEDKDCIYIDISNTWSIRDFTEKFSVEILTGLEKNTTKLMNNVKNWVSNFRPAFSIDPISNSVSLNLSMIEPKETESTLESIFHVIKNHKRQIVIAIDEFQQIREFGEEYLEPLLRSLIQNTHNATFIFSGSNKRTLMNMFSDHRKPFYNSTEILELDSIEKTEYLEFIRHHFNKNGRKIDNITLERIYDWSFGHTFTIQKICNYLFGTSEILIDDDVFNSTIQNILKIDRMSRIYQYEKILPSVQYKLLRAISKEEGIVKYTSSEFLQKYKLGASSSITKAAKALHDKEMVYTDTRTKKIMLVDVFFMRWLQYN